MTWLDPEMPVLLAELRRTRLLVQAIGVAAIFCAALFGMIHNLQSALF